MARAKLFGASGLADLTSPLVISGDVLIANLEGANSIAEDRNRAGRIYVPGMGQLMIALRSFPGAVQGEANWGDVKFTWQGRSYSVRAASPITGGAQPRAVCDRRRRSHRIASPITGGAQPRAVWVAVDSEHPSEPANLWN